MSIKAWLSVLTVVLLAVILYLSRHELIRAWELLGQVNIFILILMIPVQILVYFAGGEMIFSYLRDKGHIKNVKRSELIKVALEGNFVNHVLPSGGVSGISYLTWRLGGLGVGPGRATMAQAVRHSMAFASFGALLLVALFAVTLDGTINRWIILTSAGLLGIMIAIVASLIFLISNSRRIESFVDWLYRFLNKVIRRLTAGRRRVLVSERKLRTFLLDMHDDFNELLKDKDLLRKPFLWGLVYTLGDAGLFMIAFWSLGEVFNPAPILIAYGVASLAGFVVLTPGGTGAYEAIMVTFLAFAGIGGGVAIAGILLARVIILIGTISFGYVYYQMALSKYGDENGS